mgnify:CR=1 FL=1|tara:strand:- start:84 stop:605 length:522 start_codon:yes stop_codon:yes gene_type:complete
MATSITKNSGCYTNVGGKEIPVREDGTFILKEELKIGSLQEERLKGIIEKKYKVSLKKLDQYNPMDFVCDKFFVEIKSRRNKHDTYPTTIIGKNKIDYAKKYLFSINQFAWEEDKFKVLYVFAFEDGDWFIEQKEHNDEWIDDCEVKEITRRDGVGTNNKEHLCIPIKFLSPL